MAKGKGLTSGGKVAIGIGIVLLIGGALYFFLRKKPEEEELVKKAVDNLLFSVGKSEIVSSSFPSLDELSAYIVKNKKSLQLIGHTDDQGSDEYNLKLSQDRANAVKSYLESKGATSITAVGKGESEPIADNSTADGRSKNRRVEFKIT
jgi:OOP family OmpA-OmpF porin